MGLAGCARTEASFPDHDLTRLTFSDNSFDFVVSDQVLEHIEGDPQRAFDQTHRVLKPGGWAIHASCMLLPIHNAPADLWRFTPAALTYLARQYKRIIEVGSWGNKYVPLLIAAGLQYQKVPSAERRLLNRLASVNEAEWPCVVWIVAEK
jgi:ubiquinone/menaquinone biosynthesis C-methylase UbiE